MRPNNIIVLAGGLSVKSYDLTDLEKRGKVIGVNDSFLKFKGCFTGITMDRVWMEARVEQVLAIDKPFLVRHAAVKYIGDKISNSGNIRLFDCDESPDLSDHPEKLNGTSSGMCALNLAEQLYPDTVYLLGFDMKGDRWYEYDFKNWEPKGNKFKGWIKDFGHISKKYKNIVNVNHDSDLKCFPTITYEDFCGAAPVRQ